MRVRRSWRHLCAGTQIMAHGTARTRSDVRTPLLLAAAQAKRVPQDYKAVFSNAVPPSRLPALQDWLTSRLGFQQSDSKETMSVTLVHRSTNASYSLSFIKYNGCARAPVDSCQCHWLGTRLQCLRVQLHSQALPRPACLPARRASSGLVLRKAKSSNSKLAFLSLLAPPSQVDWRAKLLAQYRFAEVLRAVPVAAERAHGRRSRRVLCAAPMHAMPHS